MPPMPGPTVHPSCRCQPQVRACCLGVASTPQGPYRAVALEGPWCVPWQVGADPFHLEPEVWCAMCMGRVDGGQWDTSPLRLGQWGSGWGAGEPGLGVASACPVPRYITGLWLAGQT